MGSNSKKMVVWVPAIIFLLALDRFFKGLALAGVFTIPITVVGEWLKLSFSKNFNIAFSIPLGGAWLNILIFAIILALVYYFLAVAVKERNYRLAVYLALIILGAASNLYDRWLFGYVIDYIDVKYFTVFNVADIMIVGGVAGIFLQVLSVDKKR